MTNPVKFKLGGQQRSVRVELALAPRFESAAGVGIIELARQLKNFSANTTVVCEVLREALAHSGQHYSTDQVFKMVEVEGIISGYTAAGMLVADLFKSPASKKKELAESAN